MIKLNGHIITPTIFPDKTSQVWKIPENQFQYNNYIEWEFEHEGELSQIGQLAFLCAERSGKSVSGEYFRVPKLYMPFLPYGRQDKEVHNEQTFALLPFVRMLRSLPIDPKIETLDAHSDKWGIISRSPTQYIQKAIRAVGPTIILYPDKGAKNRYNNMLSGIPSVHCEKIRDQSTGEITGINLIGEIFSNDRVLIVDDICDGGKTFIEVAKLLKDRGVSDINLYTTHGIYSKGTQVLRDAGIKRIFNYKGEVLG